MNTAVGILGATVMPHALFLGSFLATRNRLVDPPATLPTPANGSTTASYGILRKVRIWFKSFFEVSRLERKAASRDYRDKYGRENNELSFIQAHLTHGLVDVLVSLFALAVPINSAYVFLTTLLDLPSRLTFLFRILVIAATVFHQEMNPSSAGLFDASDLIKDRIGKGEHCMLIDMLCYES